MGLDNEQGVTNFLGRPGSVQVITAFRIFKYTRIKEQYMVMK